MPMTTQYFDDNPLASRGSLKYVPPGFSRRGPDITYNFSQPLSLEPTHDTNTLRDQALHYFKTSGSYILILLFKSLSYGFSLLEKYTLGVYPSNGVHLNDNGSGHAELNYNLSDSGSGQGELHYNFNNNGSKQVELNDHFNESGPRHSGSYYGFNDSGLKSGSNYGSKSDSNYDASKTGSKTGSNYGLKTGSNYGLKTGSNYDNALKSGSDPLYPETFFEKLEIPDALSSSTPRGSSPAPSNVLTDRQDPLRRGETDIFKCIFELDDTDDDLVMGDQYGTSLKSTIGSKYIPRGRIYNNQTQENEVSAVDLLRTELATSRDEYDDMISRFYKPFKQAPHQQYSLTNAMLSIKPNSEFSSIFKEKRGEIQSLVTRERAEAESSIKPLSADQLSSVKQYWNTRSSNSLVVSAFSIDITVRDLQTLCDSSWLNDNVIDFYLNLVSESAQDTYCWTTHFFSTLKSKGYQGVARWAKRRKVNLAEKKKVIVPINIMGTHWAVAVVDNVAKTIGYYDSLSSGGNRKTVEILQDYMIKERERLQAPQVEYSLHHSMQTPQQQNGYDCGVFTCTVAKYVAGDTPLTFSQKDMKVIRRRMAYEIMKKSLIGDATSHPHL